MSTIEPALKSAIEVLQRASDAGYSIESEDALTKCKLALAEVEKCEPVNEVYEFEKWITGNTLIRTNLSITLDYADPLAEIAYRAWKARAKLYTSPQPIDKCEPVAYDKNKIRSEVMSKAPLPFGVCDAIDLTMQAMEKHCQLPIRKEWVGLSFKDIAKIWNEVNPYNVSSEAFARAIEAKLKQLNTSSPIDKE